MKNSIMGFTYLESIVLGILIISYPDIVGVCLPWGLTISGLLIGISLLGIYFQEHKKVHYWQSLVIIGCLQFLWSYFLYLIIEYNLNHHMAWVLIMFTVIVLGRGFYAAYITGKKYTELKQDMHTLNKLKQFQEDNKIIDREKLKK